MAKKILTEKEKIEKFIQWLKNQKESASDSASGGGSSWNWACAEVTGKIYNKAKRFFKEDLNQTK